MPAVDSCGSTIVPLEYAIEQSADADGILEYCYVVNILFPYIFGLATASLLAGKYARLDRAMRNIAIAGGVIVITSVLIPSCHALFANVRELKSASGLGLFLLVIALMSPVYFFISRSSGPVWPLCLRWLAACWIVNWFLTIAYDFTSYYGLWISLGASIWLLISCTIEASIVSHQPIRTSLWQLLIGRLRVQDPSQPRCPRCDYLLIGLTSQRCPSAEKI